MLQVCELPDSKQASSRQEAKGKDDKNCPQKFPAPSCLSQSQTLCARAIPGHRGGSKSDSLALPVSTRDERKEVGVWGFTLSDVSQSKLLHLSGPLFPSVKEGMMVPSWTYYED